MCAVKRCDMPNFEDLRLIDLIKTFRADVVNIQENRSASLFKQAGKDLQNIYNLHLTAKNTFGEVEEYLKNLYKSFNYAAVTVNNALKKKSLDQKDSAMMEECLEIMIKCCDIVTSKLSKK